MVSFSDKLLLKYNDKFQTSISHPLTLELCKGTLPNYKLFTYLVQDLKYFQIGMNIFGKTLSLCDNTESSNILGKQIGFISNDENDYFSKCLKQLRSENLQELKQNSSQMLQEDAIELPAVKKYIDYMKELNLNSKSYVEMITFLYVMEQVYLGWANYNFENGNVKENLEYKYNEWIVLHSGKEFSLWTLFLKNEVDRVAHSDEEMALCEATFVKTLDLEIEFFDECYNYLE